jgi:hypothetical protein
MMVGTGVEQNNGASSVLFTSRFGHDAKEETLRAKHYRTLS